MTITERKIASLSALTLFIAVLAALLGLAALPYIDLARLDAEIEQNTNLYNKMDKLYTARTKGLSGEKDLARGDEIPLLLAGRTTGIAAAYLQDLISQIIEDNAGKALRFQTHEAAQNDKLFRVGLTTILRANVEELRDIVHKIETMSPILFIEDMTVRPAQLDQQDRDPYFTGPLEVTLRVVGFMPLKKDI